MSDGGTVSDGGTMCDAGTMRDGGSMSDAGTMRDGGSMSSAGLAVRDPEAADRGAGGDGHIHGWRWLLARLRRRLRVVWAGAFLQWVAPAVALVALAVVAVGWFAPIPSPDRFVAVTVLLLTLGVILMAAGRKIPTPVVARAADRWLGTGDAFITAHELAGEPVPGPLAGAVERRAQRWATGVRPGAVVSMKAQPRRLGMAGAAGTAALILAFVPGPQDDARLQAAVRKATLAAQADTLQKAAAELRRTATSPAADNATEQAAQHLDDLANALQHTSSLHNARQALDRADDELARSIDPSQLTAKTAARGLERSLQDRPLTSGAGSNAAAQLRAAAGAVDARTPAERAALADRLEELARAQQAANRAAADALQRAADALRRGDAAGAARAMQDAADAQERAAERAAASDAASSAASQVAQARQGIEDAATAAKGVTPPGNATSGGDVASNVGQPGDPAARQANAGGSQPQVQGEGLKTGETAGQGRASDPGAGTGQTGGAQASGSPGAAAQGQGSQGQGAQGQGSQGQGAQGQGAQGQGSPGQGQTNGQGRGQGRQGAVSGLAPGTGTGQSLGRGDGQGPGQGLSSGRVSSSANGVSGKVAGAADNGQPHGGTGGVGTPNGSGSQPVDKGVATGSGAHIYDPGQVDRLIVTSPSNEGPTQRIGKADGPTSDGRVAVPLAQALPRYEAQAVAAVRSANLTPSERDLVRVYFDRLSKAAGAPTADSAAGAR